MAAREGIDLEADQVAFLEAAREGFERAARHTGIIEHVFRIAGLPVRLRFAGPALTPLIAPALSHLRTDEEGAADLTIDLFDSESTATPLPLMLDSLVELLRMQWWERLENRRQIRGLNGDRVHSVFHIGPNILSVFDSETNRAVYWVQSPQMIPYYEQGYPLTVLLNWWLARRERYFVHAACVGLDGGGVLVTGKGGSGKSTTTLACANAGLGVVGDDYCAFEPSNGVAHSLYNTVKLKSLSDVDRFVRLRPGFANLERVHDGEDGEKAMIFLGDHVAGAMRASLRVQAIMVPRLAARKFTTITPISPAQAFRALAPSTLFQLPGDAHLAFGKLAHLVRTFPTLELALGYDLDGVAGTLSDYIVAGRRLNERVGQRTR